MLYGSGDPNGKNRWVGGSADWQARHWQDARRQQEAAKSVDFEQANPFRSRKAKVEKQKAYELPKVKTRKAKKTALRSSKTTRKNHSFRKLFVTLMAIFFGLWLIGKNSTPSTPTSGGQTTRGATRSDNPPAAVQKPHRRPPKNPQFAN
jgi:hypothetical protein